MESLDFELRQKFDPEYFDIMNGVGLGDFVEFMKGKSLESIRLPVNNTDAFNYLRWLNHHWVDSFEGNHLNYILNLWEMPIADKPVRPPTIRELAIYNSKDIVRVAENSDMEDWEKELYIDFDAGVIRDAYQFWCYPVWIKSGLAGCIMKWGTFEDNLKPEDNDKYIIFEEYNK